MTYVDPTYSGKGSGYDQIADSDVSENISFEYGSGGRDIEIRPSAEGVREGWSGTAMQGLRDAHWLPQSDANFVDVPDPHKSSDAVENRPKP